MAKYFIPVSDNQPHSVVINGHKLVILASTKADGRKTLRKLGAEDVRELEILESSEVDPLTALAEEVGSGVVVSPPGAELESVIESLHQKLPWVH